MKDFFAHSVEGKPESEWQGLEEHLKGTAELAQGDCPGLRGQLVGDFGKKRMSEKVYNVFDDTKRDVSQVD